MDIITNRLVRDALPLFKAMASVVLLLAVGALLVLGKDIFIPIALAILLSFVLGPLVSALQKSGIGRALSIVGASLVALGVIGAILYVVLTQLADLLAELPAYRNTIQQKIRSLKDATGSGDTLSRLGSVLTDVLAEFRSITPTGGGVSSAITVRAEEAGALGAVGAFAASLMQPLAKGLVVFLLAMFMLFQREDLRNRFIKLVGTDDLQQTTAALDDAGSRVGKMLLTQLILNAGFGLLISVGLWLIGLPSPLLWGIIAGLMRFIPYIGAVIGVVFPLIIAFAVDPGWSLLLWTILLFVIIEPIVAYVLEPLLVGHTTGLSPVAILVSAIIWAFFWGPLGLVLAIPLTICLVVIGRHIPRLEFINTLLSDRPTLLPQEIFYQRMLAGDPTEATVQAREFLKGRALATYLDEIALEGVRLAHRDIIRGAVQGERLTALVGSSRQLVESLSGIDQPIPKGHTAGIEASAAMELVRPDREISRRVLKRDDLKPSWRSANPVLVVSGDHPLDSAVGLMLAQLLTKHGINATVLPFDQAQGHRNPETGLSLICLSFIEPLSTVHLRLAVMQARQRAPEAAVMLCIWQQRDIQLVTQLVKRVRASAVVTTMADALEQVVRLGQKVSPQH